MRGVRLPLSAPKIMQVIQTLNPENASEEEVSKFVVRHAARAVVFDNKGLAGEKYNGTTN